MTSSKMPTLMQLYAVVMIVASVNMVFVNGLMSDNTTRYPGKVGDFGGTYAIREYGFTTPGTRPCYLNITTPLLNGNLSKYTLHVGLNSAYSYLNNAPQLEVKCYTQSQSNYIATNWEVLTLGSHLVDLVCNYFADDFISFIFGMQLQSFYQTPHTLSITYIYLTTNSLYNSNITTVYALNYTTTDKTFSLQTF